MNWILLTFLGIFFRSVYSLATKLLSDSLKSPISISVIQPITSALLAIPFGLAIRQLNLVSLKNTWHLMLLIIFTLAIGNILYYQGIKFLDTGATQVAFSSILIWGVLLSVLFLGSKFSYLQLLGAALMLVAIILIQYQKGFSLNKGVLFIVASACLFALFQVASAKVSTQLSTGTYLVFSNLGSALILLAVYPKTVTRELKKAIGQLRSVFMATVFAASTSLLYFIFTYFAYQKAPDSGIVVILLTAQVILSVLLGIVFLKETKNMSKKIMAGILAFIASLLIKS